MKKFFAVLACFVCGALAFGQYSNVQGVANSVNQVLSLSLYEDGSGNRGIGLYVIDSSGTWPSIPAAGFNADQIYSQSFYRDSSGNGALGVFLIGAGGILPAGTVNNSTLRWSGTAWVEELNLSVNTGVVNFGRDGVAGRISIWDGGTLPTAYVGKFLTATLTSDQTYTLPDASGTVLLDEGGGSLPAGSTDNGMLTWNDSGSVWVAESRITFDGNDQLTMLPQSTYTAKMRFETDRTVIFYTASPDTRTAYEFDRADGQDDIHTRWLDNGSEIMRLESRSASRLGDLTLGGHVIASGNMVATGYLQTGNTSNAGTLYVYDGTNHSGSFVTSALASSQTYTLPDASSKVPITAVGTSLPGTCEQGVWYNDTDSDDCADTGAGDGALCHCTATNTWSLVVDY